MHPTYMALVISRVKLDTIPAGWEESFSAKLAAWQLRELRGLARVGSAQAIVLNGSLSIVRTIIGSAKAVSIVMW